MAADYTLPLTVNKLIRFYDGQFLQDQDFVDEQKYHNARRNRHHRTLHISGVGEGMSVYTPANSTFQIKVRAGLAVDAHGRQIVQSKTSSPIDIPAEAANNSRWLYVVFHQQPEDMQSSGQGVQGETRWLEAPYYFTTAAVLGVDDTYTGPDWNAYISQGEGPPPPVLLAKLAVDGNGGVSIDETVRQYSGVRLPGPGSIAPVLRTDTNGNVGLWQVDGNKLSERLTVTPAGHLGINSHAPTAALEIGSTLRATRNGQALVGLKISPTFDAGGRSNIKNHGLIVEHGSVGIGTTDPGGFKLRVNGDLHANKVVVQNGVNGGNTRGLWMWSAGDSNWGIYMGQSGSARSLSGGTAVAGAGFSSHAVRFRTYASETNGLIYENSNEELNLSVRGNDGQTYIRGSVGIGATAPAGLLEIKGSAASTKIKFGGTGGDAHHLSSARDMVFNAEISDNNPAFLFRSSTYDDLSSLTELMAILGNGNVGIGTTSPEGALDINKGRAEAQANATNGALAYGSEKADLVLTRRHSATKSLNGYPASLIDFRATNVSQEWSVAQVLGVVDQNSSGGYSGGLAILTSPGGSTDAAGRRNTSAAPITRMVVDANGNVGVGTTAPAEKLEVAGNIRVNGAIVAPEGTLRDDGGGWVRTYGNTGWYSQTHGGGWYMVDSTWIRSYNNKNIYQNAGILRTDGTFQVGGNGDRFIVDSNGYVGIGARVNGGIAKVVIEGAQEFEFEGVGILGRGGAVPGTIRLREGMPYSLFAGEIIAAAEFHAHSDARIKNVLGRSNHEQDLQALLKIEVSDYTFVDTLAKGSQSQKKVIGQQIKEVFPQAVTTIKNVVPDIYKAAEVKNGWIDLDADLAASERVKLMIEDKTAIYDVLEVGEKGFRVDLEHEGKVFVYGREVKDFHMVDYEAISMLNISATQRLYRLVQEQQKKLEEQSRQNELLQKSVGLLQEKLSGKVNGKAV